MTHSVNNNQGTQHVPLTAKTREEIIELRLSELERKDVAFDRKSNAIIDKISQGVDFLNTLVCKRVGGAFQALLGDEK